MDGELETYAMDATGWPIREGTRVRVKPRPMNGCSIAPKPYSARVVGCATDEAGILLIVRAEKNWNQHVTRVAQVRVMKPGKGRKEMQATARLRGDRRRRR